MDVALEVPIVIGRDPTVPPGYPQDAQLCAAEDPTRQISKTHVALSLRGGSVWVEDLHSTNGVIVEEAGGRSGRLPAGKPVRLQHDARVRFGSLSVQVLLRG
jgi:pSer/pThr/pTyr-binding forkhead associated (FHA) protein